MSDIGSEIIILLLLIIANGIFAMSEIAIVSVRKIRLQQRINEGDEKAKVALSLANEPTLFLSTVQIGITLVGIFAGAYGGATLSEELAVYLEGIPFIGGYKDTISFVVVVAIITYLSLVIGELVPKRLGLNDPEKIAIKVAKPMQLISKIAAPLVYLLSASTEIIFRAMRIKPSNEPPVTEEEIKVLIEQGTQAGMFEEAEQDMVERIFRLGDQRVSNLFTPRTRVVWLDVDDPLEVSLKIISQSVYSRFPVCQGDLDHVLGILQVKDILDQALNGEAVDLRTYLQDPLFVPETMRGLKVLELFKQSGTHTALVIDEYGHIQGMVTMNDILEAIVGDLPSIDETNDPGIIKRDDGSWLLDGMIGIEEFKELFELEELPGEDRENYHTLGGFAMMYMERIPTAGDKFDWGGLRFEIIDMDGKRVDKLLVTQIGERKD